MKIASAAALRLVLSSFRATDHPDAIPRRTRYYSKPQQLGSGEGVRPQWMDLVAGLLFYHIYTYFSHCSDARGAVRPRVDFAGAPPHRC